jgi:hypothetical protein
MTFLQKVIILLIQVEIRLNFSKVLRTLFLVQDNHNIICTPNQLLFRKETTMSLIYKLTFENNLSYIPTYMLWTEDLKNLIKHGFSEAIQDYTDTRNGYFVEGEYLELQAIDLDHVVDPDGETIIEFHPNIPENEDEYVTDFNIKINHDTSILEDDLLKTLYKVSTHIKSVIHQVIEDEQDIDPTAIPTNLTGDEITVWVKFMEKYNLSVYHTDNPDIIVYETDKLPDFLIQSPYKMNTNTWKIVFDNEYELKQDTETASDFATLLNQAAQYLDKNIHKYSLESTSK